MLYDVRAKPKAAQLRRFWTVLTDGTVANQEPDGYEIIASMKRALLTGGIVEWSETCYCTTPLNHERTTVYDQFFSDIEIQPHAGPTNLTGEQFWRYLLERFKEAPKISSGETLTARIRHIPLRIA